MNAFLLSQWPAFAGLALTALLWALKAWVTKLNGEHTVTTTTKVLQVLASVAVDTVTKAQSTILPALEAGRTRQDIVAALTGLAIAEAQEAGSDIIRVAGWSQEDVRAQLINFLETAVAKVVPSAPAK